MTSRRLLVIAVISFLTLVDLFAAQAILPSLVQAYRVDAAAMGLAVNASTLGMAAAGLLVALFSRRIERRRGIWMSLALLSIPTMLLSFAGDLTSFALLRVAQGIFMAAAFTLTMAHLAEACGARDVAAALAAYITGNVASNLLGRLMSAALAEQLGLAGNFQLFAALNLAGALLAWMAIGRTAAAEPAGAGERPSALAAWMQHLRNPALRASFATGFLILFVFIGTFTYVNFVLAAAPLRLSAMELGLVYLVFLPSIFTTPLAGAAARRFGARPTVLAGLAAAGAGLPLLVVPVLTAVLAGLALLAAGTFLAQAAATGFVGRAARGDRGAASGLYLAAYYVGGLAGSALLGEIFVRLGWTACVIALGVALGLCAVLALRMTLAPEPAMRPAAQTA